MSARHWYLRKFGWIPRPVRQVIVLVIGCTLLLIALLGMVLPIMPGFIFLPLALAILAAEFAWAARWLLTIRRAARNVIEMEAHKAPWPARWLLEGRDGVIVCWRTICRRPKAPQPVAPADRRTDSDGPDPGPGVRSCMTAPSRPANHAPGVKAKLPLASPE